MKKILIVYSLLLCFAIMLTLSSCTTPAETDNSSIETQGNKPDDALTYDLSRYEYFSDIFEQNDDVSWEDKGRYTLYLIGLCTPVTVEMDGLDVLSVSAYGRKKTVNLNRFQGYVNAEIDAFENAILLNDCEDNTGNTWIFTQAQCFEFHPVGDVSTQVYVDEKGDLCYKKYIGAYYTSFDQWYTAPLDLCSSRDDFVFETGRAHIVQEKVVLTAEKTLTLSDLFDLDEIFATAKSEGEYAEYNSADEVLAANKDR